MGVVFPPPGGGTPGIIPPAGDLGGTIASPTVISTHLAAPLPIAQGGTGSTSENFVDLSNAQTIGGAKTFSASPTAPSYSASGLTGATAGAIFAGGTTSGAPTTGTHAVGEFVVDQTGAIWVCTVAGTPGTWKQVSGGGGAEILGLTNYAPNPQVQVTLSTTLSVLSASTLFVTFTAPASGRVIVTTSLVMEIAGINSISPIVLGYSSSSTTVSVVGYVNTTTNLVSTNNQYQQITFDIVVAGLTAGQSYTFYMVGYAGTANYALITAIGQTANSAYYGGPVVIKVLSA